MRRLFVLPVAAALLLAPAAVPAASATVMVAQTSSPLVGTYALVPAKSDDIDKAIDAAVAQLNFLLRPIAHSRLKGTNDPYKTVTIAVTERGVTTTMDGRAPITAPAGGGPIKWKREDGEVFDVSHALTGDRQLTQTFKAEDGTRTNKYVLSADGKTLTMHVTITSGKLPKPLTYKLVYQRKS